MISSYGIILFLYFPMNVSLQSVRYIKKFSCCISLLDEDKGDVFRWGLGFLTEQISKGQVRIFLAQFVGHHIAAWAWRSQAWTLASHTVRVLKKLTRKSCLWSDNGWICINNNIIVLKYLKTKIWYQQVD